MKIVFYASPKPREMILALALKEGAESCGDTFEIRRPADYGETDDGDDRKYPGPTEDTDVAVVFGVKGRSRQIIVDHLAMGLGTLFMDKGYTRQKGPAGHTLYTRISVNGPDPNRYFMGHDRSNDRFERLGITLRQRRADARSGGNILLCISSNKYHSFHRIGDPIDFSESVVNKIRKVSKRHIIWRPKPNKMNARIPDSIGGVSVSTVNCSIQDALRNCHVLITHGSAAAMDAIFAGVPAITLGGSIAKPVSGTRVQQVENPFWPESALLAKWAANMAYCQWTTEELKSGEAWEDLRRELKRQKKKGLVKPWRSTE